MSRICPQCKSDAVMSKRAIHLNGTSASYSGVTASALAIDCMPPALKLSRPDNRAILVFAGVFVATACAAGTFSLNGACVAGVLAALVYVIAKRKNAKAVAANSLELAQYEKEWRCLTCAHTFVPGAA